VGLEGVVLLGPSAYTEERHDIAVEGGVMTGVEAALLASSASSKTLALSHIGSAARPGYARREAAQFHNRVVIPNDGDRFKMQVSDDNRVEHNRSPPGQAPRA
jgi:ribonuclease BN (tRNA processing enzyme)